MCVLNGRNGDASKKEAAHDIDGEVVLQKADYSAIARDDFFYLQLVSSDQVDPETGHGKTVTELTCLRSNRSVARDTQYRRKFKWKASLEFPRAFLIKNMDEREFFLKSLTLSIPGKGKVRFHCNSWIWPCRLDQKDRVFFSNKSFLPEQTPVGLRKWRELDLVEIRGDGTGERKESDRIYDYDVYNDLGKPDSDVELTRRVLGGSKDFPYPRRCRTGRPPTKTAPEFESRVRFRNKNFIPPDERFSHSDFSDFKAHIVTASTKIIPRLANRCHDAFDSFGEISELYGRESPRNFKSLPENVSKVVKGIVHGATSSCSQSQHKRKSQAKVHHEGEVTKRPRHDVKDSGLTKFLPPQIGDVVEVVKRAYHDAKDGGLTNFTHPQIVKVDEYAWRKDEEFARQALAGVNPLVIQCLQKFALSSSLDENMYGPQKSAITKQHIKKNLQGLSVDQAIASKRLFVIDYYDAYMPYVERINKLSDDRKMYASRMLLFLTSEKTLIPLAIELCLPPTDGKESVRKVFTPEEGAVWLLAKVHARVNDAGFHQLVSHWLRTHCITEPIIIATHRQLSTMHPLFKLLVPHYLNTMDINQYARSTLINAEGIIEEVFTSGKYSMEISSKAYKDWKFNEQGLPADLLKRGMAVRDPKAPHGLRLVIEDYPYAVDGLEIWFALRQWVSDYFSLYYKEFKSVKNDKEFQAWWYEIVNVGHEDLKDDPSRWYKMDSLDDLFEAITTIIWITSAHHAAVNFGQYSYGGYVPNMPTMSRRLIPEKGTPEYEELLKDTDGYFLKTVSTPFQSSLVMAVLEILSKHANNEVYLGQLQGSTMDSTDDSRVKVAFQQFQDKMKKVEKDILDRNNKSKVYKNRHGPAKLPYTLLYLDTTTNRSKSVGLTGSGVPNSISI